MLFEIKDLKTDNLRQQFFVDNYRGFEGLFNSFYTEEDVKYVYIKKAIEDEPLKTYIFFENKFVVVTKEEISYVFEEVPYEKVSKKIKAHKHSSREVELKLTFDNNIEVIFNNHNDALYGDHESYGDDLKELFKNL